MNAPILTIPGRPTIEIDMEFFQTLALNYVRKENIADQITSAKTYLHTMVEEHNQDKTTQKELREQYKTNIHIEFLLLQFDDYIAMLSDNPTEISRKMTTPMSPLH
jgi:hypothetical protein